MGTLKKIAQFRGLTQSDLAVSAEVSRQAVSLWFAHGSQFVPVSSEHLLKLSKSLEVSADTLLNDIVEPAFWEQETTHLLWDRLYKDLTEFLKAIDNKELRALSRLVEVYGLFASEKIAGPVIWSAFEDYKRFLPPIRRNELEQLWRAQKNLHLI